MSTTTKLLQQQIKTILSSMAERDFKRVFEKYLEISNQKLQKTCKQISYKCFEASTAIKSRRATGFGRNQNQAVTNSIKNLIESLLDDDKVVSIMKECIKRSNEGMEEDKENVKKVYFDVTKYSNQQKSALGNNSSLLNISYNDDANKSKQKNVNNIQNINIQSLKLQQPQKQSNNEKGIHNRNSFDKSLVASKSTTQQQLKKAKEYILTLENNLKSVLKQNEYLKELLNSKESKQLTNNFLSTNINKSIDFEKQNSLSISTAQNKVQISSLMNNSTNLQEKKTKVPRLKLQILPNYHGKSNKSLNQSLLAAYQQKQKIKPF